MRSIFRPIAGIVYPDQTQEEQAYPTLTSEDREILDTVIQRFGRASKNEIVETMHHEDAYTETAPNDIIQFKYAATLSIG